jgi:hypothetical protein
MFNQTMIFCLGDIQTAIGGSHTVTTLPPKMVLQNNNIEIYYDSSAFGDDATGTERCRVFVNDDFAGRNNSSVSNTPCVVIITGGCDISIQTEVLTIRTGK